MSLERKYQPRKGIMLSTFKSVSQLDTTNFDSSAQSPQYKSKKEKPGLNMSHGVCEKRGFPLRRVSLREKKSGIECKFEETQGIRVWIERWRFQSKENEATEGRLSLSFKRGAERSQRQSQRSLRTQCWRKHSISLCAQLSL